MLEQRFSISNDPKTESLYNQITKVHLPSSYQEQALLKQAQTKTEINSHYNHYDPTKVLNNCFVYSGVSLVQSDPTDVYRYKYRPYTIVKATEEAKSPISEEELFKRLAHSKHQEIVYTYANPIISSYSRQPAIKSMQIVNQNLFHQTSTRSLDKIKAELESSGMEKTKKRPITRSKDRSEVKGIAQKSQKSEKVSRLNKEQSSNLLVIDTDQEKYTFKTVKNRATGGKSNVKKSGNYNLFSCLDEPINKQCQNQELTCGRNEIIATKLGSQNWRR